MCRFENRLCYRPVNLLFIIIIIINNNNLTLCWLMCALFRPETCTGWGSEGVNPRLAVREGGPESGLWRSEARGSESGGGGGGGD